MLGINELRRKKVQFGLITAMVALVVYLLLMLNGLGNGLHQAMIGSVAGLNGDLVVYDEDANLSVQRSEVDAAALAAVARTEGVAAAGPLGHLTLTLLPEDGRRIDATLWGYEPGLPGEPDTLREGNPLAPGDVEHVLVDRSLAEEYGLRAGDALTLRAGGAERRVTVRGVVSEGKYAALPTVYATLTLWDALKHANVTGERPAASVVLVRAAEGADVGALARRIDGAVPGTQTVSRDAAALAVGGVREQDSVVYGMLGFTYLVGTLIVGVFFYVLTLQKIGQIGVVKAVGASTWYVFRELVKQVLAVMLLGTAVGAPLAALTVQALRRQMPLFDIDPGSAVVGVLLLAATALLGTLFSARQIARVDPIIALGQVQ
ncbi:MAG TPA: ABC transporter permease [Dehalococcoidia bacterium]